MAVSESVARAASKSGASTRPNGNTIDMGVLGNSLGFHIRLAQMANFRQFARLVKKPSATPTQFTTLVLIDANPGLSQVELGSVLQMDRATTMTVIDKLQHKKWVMRIRSTTDRRKHELHLTAQGRAALKSLQDKVSAHEEHFASNLTQRETQHLLKLLQKLLSGHVKNGA